MDEVRTLLGPAPQQQIGPTGYIWLYQHDVSSLTVYPYVTSGSRSSETVRVTFDRNDKVASCTTSQFANEPTTGFAYAGIGGAAGGGNATSIETFCSELSKPSP